MTERILPVINFIAGSRINNKVFDLLSWCVFAGFEYEQVVSYIKKEGYYMPKDQYLVYKKLLNIQEELEIGARQNENYS